MTIYTFLITDFNSHEARVHKIFAENMNVAIKNWAHLAVAEDIIQKADVQELFPKLDDVDFISNVIENNEFEITSNSRNLPIQVQCFYKELPLPYYDILAVVQFIYNKLPVEIKARIKVKDIRTMIDLMYDFYLEKGWVVGSKDDYDVNIPPETEIDYDELGAFIQKKAEGKGKKYLIYDVDEILDLEYKYMIELGIGKEEDGDEEGGEMSLN